MSQSDTAVANGMSTFQTGREAVYHVCQDILANGEHVAPRGMETKELLGYSFLVTDPRDTLADGINRQRFHAPIAAAEALQDVAGVATPWLMSRISSGFPKPSSRWDEGVQTYGKRLYEHGQLDAVVAKLRKDPDSRQALALIWRPTDVLDTPEAQAHNICTITLQFLVRRGMVCMFVYMRSNDAWHGLPYDLHQFAQVQGSIANSLGLQMGPYLHAASSMHLYDKHWEAAAQLEEPGSFGPVPTHCHTGFGRQGMPFSEIRGRALAILAGQEDVLNGGPTETESWHIDQIARYLPDGM